MVGWKKHVHYALQICLCMRAREMGRDSHTHQSRRKPRPFCTSSKSPGTSPGTYRSGRLTLQEVAPPASFDRRRLSQPLARRRRRSEEEQWSSSFQCLENRLPLRTPFLSHAHLLNRAPRVQSKRTYIHTTQTSIVNQSTPHIEGQTLHSSAITQHDVTSFPPKISLLPSSSTSTTSSFPFTPSLSHTQVFTHIHTLSLSLSLPLSHTHTQRTSLSLSLSLSLCLPHVACRVWSLSFFLPLSRFLFL